MLSTQNAGDLSGCATKDFALQVDNEPLPLDIGLLCDFGTHRVPLIGVYMNLGNGAN